LVQVCGRAAEARVDASRLLAWIASAAAPSSAAGSVTHDPRDMPRVAVLVAELERLVRSGSGPPRAQFKAVVRVETRVAARWLVRRLDRVPGVRPALLLGRGAQTPDGPFTSAAMRQSLSSFRDVRTPHTANVLVATSVVQEGVNVPACNLVVCFDACAVQTGAQLTQLVGRARAPQSRFVVLLANEAERASYRRAVRQAENEREVLRSALR